MMSVMIADSRIGGHSTLESTRKHECAREMVILAGPCRSIDLSTICTSAPLPTALRHVAVFFALASVGYRKEQPVCGSDT